MLGMICLCVPDVLLIGASLYRSIAQGALEHSKLLIRGVPQPIERRFLGASVHGTCSVWRVASGVPRPIWHNAVPLSVLRGLALDRRQFAGLLLGLLLSP